MDAQRYFHTSANGATKRTRIETRTASRTAFEGSGPEALDPPTATKIAPRAASAASRTVGFLPPTGGKTKNTTPMSRAKGRQSKLRFATISELP